MITITIPTKQRKQRLENCIRSIKGDYRILIGCADPVEDIPESVLNDDRCLFYVTHDPIVKVQNMLASKASVDSHILPISDDIEFESKAIEEALLCMSRVFSDSDGAVGFNITNMTKQQSSPYAFMLIGAKFFNQTLHRTLFNEEYYHFYADTELGQKADDSGKFTLCEKAKIKHFHPCTGIKPDSTHLHKRNEKWKHDCDIYQRRLCEC